MFTTEAAARKKFKWLLNKHQQYRKLNAEKLAVGTLSEDHGLQTKPSKGHHFDLHEYSDTDVVESFEIMGDLP